MGISKHVKCRVLHACSSVEARARQALDMHAKLVDDTLTDAECC
jgi:hypothetical protein